MDSTAEAIEWSGEMDDLAARESGRFSRQPLPPERTAQQDSQDVLKP